MQENRRGKMKKTPAREVVEHLIRPAIASDLSRSYQTILDINKAHVVMLAEESIIEKDVAGRILDVTAKMARMGDNPEFEITPDVEDLYFNLERYLIQETGIDVGGRMHTARSRNDLTATVARMDSRTAYLQLCAMFIDLRKTLIALAKDNLDAAMAGYSHLQPSEPITFAHYCSAVLNALERDYARLAHAWATLNICPLGGCSMGSTTFPINRESTARSLGFDAPMANSIDCVASRDYALEIVGALAMTANTFSRLAQDLYVWATPEYKYIEVDDSVAVCSSIMPQKKNPVTLEHIKGKAAHIEGFWISIFSALKNVAYTHSRDVSGESMRFYWTALQEMKAAFDLLAVTLKTLKVNKEHMLEAAKDNFCTVTELANYLVRYDTFSFRAAHEILALVVDYMMVNNKKSSEITLEELNAISLQLVGKKTTLTAGQVALALDPALNAKSKTAGGGASPEEVTRQLTALEKILANDETVLTKRASALEQAKKQLDAKAEKLALA